ncbi:MAG: tetratricopeptide repeat protein [Candidatus Saliniplasma sp.]
MISTQFPDDLLRRLQIPMSLNDIATIYWHKGRPDKALEYYEECLKIVEGIGENRDVTNMGCI